MKKIFIILVLLTTVNFAQFVAKDSIETNTTNISDALSEILSLTNDLETTTEALERFLGYDLQGELNKMQSDIDTLLARQSRLTTRIEVLENTVPPIVPPLPPTDFEIHVTGKTSLAGSFSTPASVVDSVYIESKVYGVGSYVYATKVDSGVTTFSLTGLDSNTVYQARAYSIKYNEGSILTSAYSNADTGRTLAGDVQTPPSGNVIGQWFVDGSVVSSGNGQSYTTAWKTFNNINWTNVQAGDTIIVSGGTDSITYTNPVALGKSGTSGSEIVIMGSPHTGHNGKAILDGVDNSEHCFIINDIDYVKICNLYIRNVDEVFHIGTSATYIYIDSIDARNVNNGVYVFGATYDYDFTVNHLYVTNSTFETVTNSGIQTDVIYIQWAADIVIDNCKLYQINTEESGHNDNIQFQYGGNITVSNNLMYNVKHEASQGLIFQYHPAGYTHLIYNNALYMPNTTISAGIQLGYGYTGAVNEILYGNTIVASTDQAIAIFGLNTNIYLTMKNNILVSRTGEKTVTVEGKITPAAGRHDIDYNLYDGATWNGSYSLSTLQSNGYETHGYISDANLTDISGDADFDFTVTTGNAIDNGVTLGAPYNRDILGVSRPQGSGYDIGAYEQ